MKSILPFLFLSLPLHGQMIMRKDTVNQSLVNVYGDELQEMAKKAGVSRAFGYSKSITFRDNQCYETVIIYYRDKDGETQDRIVSARIINFNELAHNKKEVKSVVEHKLSDSLQFAAKSVRKAQTGYIVSGNVIDKGVEIPVVLATAPKEHKADSTLRTFEPRGFTVFANGRPMGCVFRSRTDDTYLFKLLDKNKLQNYYQRLTDNCYEDEFIVSQQWWNGQRAGMSWEAQLKYMREKF